MAEGICTERDWRRNGGSIRYAAPPCWGAAYIRLPHRKSIHRNRLLHAGMLLCALAVSAVVSLAFRSQPVQTVFPVATPPAQAEHLSIRMVPGLSFSKPVGTNMVSRSYSTEQLYRGKLLLLDAEHPLPAEAPSASAVNIATYGKGMVPVNDLSLKCGRETIHALGGLFRQLRESGAGAFTVWRGTAVQPAGSEQAAAQMLQLAKEYPLERAAAMVMDRTAASAPELQQPYTVELRMPGSIPFQPDETPPEETVAGRQLLRLAWRNGFIRTKAGDGAAFLFRYVGKAHATAMTYLDVGLEDYLTILHRKEQLTLHDDGATYYIQCVPAQGEYTVFTVPAGAACEVSMDNTGYAVIACTLPKVQ